ncbi:uncharacterized protein LOC132260736 [Phlebotomus argentipes]|uniref:uncharacterized protein LOC132260736 n=1 Tax=Phlebotomus argentipes TaxID=94469 RepID=UPI002892BCD2|nr:uncharacterized protein LOC132260736 [Phlebotomus argentipes]
MSDARRRTEWNDAANETFIDIWTDFKPIFRRKRVHKQIYDKFRATLARHGVRKTVSEIKSKMKNLRKRYRQENEWYSHNSKWNLYARMHQFENFTPKYPLKKSPSLTSSIKDEEISMSEGAEDSCSSEHTVQSITSVPVAPALPPDPPQRDTNRQFTSIDEELLAEFRKSNQLTHEFNESVSALMRESLELSREHNSLLQTYLDKLPQ